MSDNFMIASLSLSESKASLGTDLPYLLSFTWKGNICMAPVLGQLYLELSACSVGLSHQPFSLCWFSSFAIILHY